MRKNKTRDRIGAGFFGRSELRDEIARYNELPVIFNGFLDARGYGDDTFRIECVEKFPGNPIFGDAPTYYFEIIADGANAGYVSLRVGFSRNLYYSGQIGYTVNARQRGRGYAGRACRLLIPLMRAHGMTKVLITNNPDNTASRRVCEKLGAKFLRVVKIPRSHELYKAGDRYKNIFEWDFGASTV